MYQPSNSTTKGKIALLYTQIKRLKCSRQIQTQGRKFVLKLFSDIFLFIYDDATIKYNFLNKKCGGDGGG